MKVTLRQPNDYVTYTADIENEGDVDAEINLITPPNLSSEQSKLFDFSVVYTDNNTAPAKGDLLGHGQTRNITIIFRYKDITDENLLPDEPLTFNLSYSIEYIQSNSKVTTTTAQAGSNYGEEIASKEISEGITATYYGGTPIVKSETNSNIVPMSYTNELADDVRYQGGTLVISGSGAMLDTDFENAEVPIHLFLCGVQSIEDVQLDENENIIYKYNPTNLVIEEGITKVGNSSFQGISSIENIELPSTLKEIGEEAFEFTRISIIRLPKGLESIGEAAFYGLHSTREIYIPSTVTEIRKGIDSTFELIDDNNSIIYCETQEVANLLVGKYGNALTLVDPTKFN